jgi:hypothetical protein
VVLPPNDVDSIHRPKGITAESIHQVCAR